MIAIDNIPKGWRLVKLGDILSVSSGKGIKVNQLEGGKYPVYGGNGINGYHSKYLIEDETLIIGRVGVKCGVTYITKPKAWVTDNALIVNSKAKDFDLKFLKLKLEFENLNKLSVSTAQPVISGSKIYAYEIILPPLNAQQAIVSKIEELLSELDKGIENLRIAQQQLKTYRQSVLKWAFEGKLTEEWRRNQGFAARLEFRSHTSGTKVRVPTGSQNKGTLAGIEPATSVQLSPGSPDGGSRVPVPSGPQEENGGLPEGWEWVKMGEIIEKPKYGTSKKCDYETNGKGVLRIPNITNGMVDSTDLKFATFDKSEIETYCLKEGDILTIRSNGSVDLVGKCALVSKRDEEFLYAGYLIRLRPLRSFVLPKYLVNALSSIDLRNQIEEKAKSTSGVNNINSEELAALIISLPTIAEQKQIVQEIEDRLSVTDKMEESITQSLQQAEALRQSILKKAFEGNLVAEKAPTVYKPKNVYFFQTQTLAYINFYSNKKQIQHGEMTIAKYGYLLDKIYKIPTYYDYKRWHLGPYPPEIKKAINNKKHFNITSKGIKVVDEEKLFGYSNPYKKQIENAVAELAEIFSKYKETERSHKTELLATVCKVVEDIQSSELPKVRTSMKEWKINFKNTSFKNKAEKFTEEETKKCLAFINEKGWDKKLMNN